MPAHYYRTELDCIVTSAADDTSFESALHGV